MSWIITRHLCKSGGHQIRFRIGQFNKRSSSKMVHCKQLSTALMQSDRCIAIQNKLRMGRQENVLHNMYASIDNHVSESMLHVYTDPKVHLHEDLWLKTYAREIIMSVLSQYFVPSTIRRFGFRFIIEFIGNKDRQTVLERVAHIIEKNKKYYSLTKGCQLPKKWVEYMNDEGYMGYYNLTTKEISYSSTFILVEKFKKMCDM